MDKISNFVKRVLPTSPRYSSYIVEFDNGDKFERVAQGCYGFIDEFCQEEKIGVISLTVFHPWKKFNREVVKFILNEEPFSKYFITKGVNKGRINGFVVDLSHPYEEILGAMIALRSCWNMFNETLFQAFRNVGVPIIEAMLMAERFYLDDNFIFMHEHSYDHYVFPTSVCLKDLIKLDYKSASDLTATDSGSIYNSVWSCWGKQTGKSSRKSVLFPRVVDANIPRWSTPYMIFSDAAVSNLYKIFKKE